MSANPPFDGIVLMNADGSSPTLLTNPYNADCWCGDQEPFFTPDGSQIVFSRENWITSTEETEDIYIMNVDGSGVTNLTDGTGVNFDPMIVVDSSAAAKRILIQFQSR